MVFSVKDWLKRVNGRGTRILGQKVINLKVLHRMSKSASLMNAFSFKRIALYFLHVLRILEEDKRTEWGKESLFKQPHFHVLVLNVRVGEDIEHVVCVSRHAFRFTLSTIKEIKSKVLTITEERVKLSKMG